MGLEPLSLSLPICRVGSRKHLPEELGGFSEITSVMPMISAQVVMARDWAAAFLEDQAA